MKESLSYLWPLKKKVRSKYNGTLEVTWLNGKKLLDSQSANYSYGALQQVLDLGLAQVKADRAAPVLVLGLGGGSVLDLLREKYNYYGKITAVELDPVVIDIAEKEFSVSRHWPLEIVCQDAIKFVQKDRNKYGLIIVDVFVDLEVPQEFFSAGFWKGLAQNLQKDGKLLFNAGINLAHAAQVDRLIFESEPFLEFQKKEQIYGSNTLLFGRKK